MARKRGGIGALGSAQARFFHPNATIREKWPNDQKVLRSERVFVTGKELFHILWKDQVAYKYRIPDIDNGIKFHIYENKFLVDQDPEQPLGYELVSTALTHYRAPEPDNKQEARGTNDNTRNNIGRGSDQEDIAEIQLQGVKVENEDCLPENLLSGRN